MSYKVAFIGSGSFGFTRTVMKDILTFPRLADAEIALMDIDPERLELSRLCCQKIIDVGGYPAKLKTYKTRRGALEGADAVVVTILSGGTDVWKHDILIPKKYGVDICIGDTRGPSGIFRALRTIPKMLEICRDVAKYCPGAILLNYTNPMAMLCHAMQVEYPELTISGLCHSVQGTAHMLAGKVGLTEDDVDYVCAGLNHLAWYLKFEHQGRDLLPRLRKVIDKEAKASKNNRWRNELFLTLGYYVTESSRHNSEYNWWVRKRPDLLDRYFEKVEDSLYTGENAFLLNKYLRRNRTWRRELKNWLEHADWKDPAATAKRLQRGNEYAASIVNAWTGGELYTFNGNVPNTGVIPNLPQGACVEVPVMARRGRLQTVHVGELPKSVLSITALTANNEMMAVEGALRKDGRMVYQSIVNDPLTAAVLSLPEIRKMTLEMFARNRKYLPGYRMDY